MSISEFKNNLKCDQGKIEGFEGRKNGDLDYAVNNTELVEKEIWEWQCKYCGNINKLYFRRTQ